MILLNVLIIKIYAEIYGDIKYTTHDLFFVLVVRSVSFKDCKAAYVPAKIGLQVRNKLRCWVSLKHIGTLAFEPTNGTVTIQYS